MKKAIYFLLILLCGVQIFNAQSPAHRRAARIGPGMNLTYLDNWWLGTKEKKYSDFARAADAAKREKMFADIARNGFKTVRIPVSFGAWANYEKPFRWTHRENLKHVDSFVSRVLKNNLNAIIDLHHVEFDGKVEGAATTERVVWLWREIATRYKNTDPERVFFELRNEPHDIDAAVWRAQAEAIIEAVRQIAPNHTLIVGFHDWNSRAARMESKPFADANIIYTFHYYHPFLFTHQGATWSSEGLGESKNIPFPAHREMKLTVPETAKGKWTESLFNNYLREANAEQIFKELKEAKDWSEKTKSRFFSANSALSANTPRQPTAVATPRRFIPRWENWAFRTPGGNGIRGLICSSRAARRKFPLA
ncbi:MAG TPA: cellulase family glycosylhydrolase [Pyrinomonadaceae bacterium]|nr:cellulase family glycosylhydrolase [Pyrinomonadaceae bacterium]